MSKIQIRKSVFETNSSSTHSICISKAPVTIDKNRIIAFYLKDYGWENDVEYHTPNYLYTALMCFDDHDELLAKLKSILDKHDIKYTFEPPEIKTYVYDGVKHSYLDNGGIDHSGETRDFVDAMLSDEDLLLRFIYGDSCVYTGNDNEDDAPETKNVAEAHCYDPDKNCYAENPYHDAEHYDYFYKGN